MKLEELCTHCAFYDGRGFCWKDGVKTTRDGSCEKWKPYKKSEDMQGGYWT